MSFILYYFVQGADCGDSRLQRLAPEMVGEKPYTWGLLYISSYVYV